MNLLISSNLLVLSKFLGMLVHEVISLPDKLSDSVSRSLFLAFENINVKHTRTAHKNLCNPIIIKLNQLIKV